MHLLAYLHYPQISPEIFRIPLGGGPNAPHFAVRWYGLAYLTGFILAYVCLRAMIRKGMLRLTADALNDVMTWLVLGIIVGGRLGWWLFYHRPVPGEVEPWWEPIAIWHGGMSFHGGLAGVLIVMIIWTRRHHAPLWNLADAAALVTPIGLCLGRIANFINDELVGRVTTVPWGMIFPHHGPLPRHPSQLYESFFEGPVLLAALWIARLVFKPKEGRIGALFVILYGIIRFSVEFTREPDVQLGFIVYGLTMGQLLSLGIVLIGILLWVWLGRQPAPAIAVPADTAKPVKKQS